MLMIPIINLPCDSSFTVWYVSQPLKVFVYIVKKLLNSKKFQRIFSRNNALEIRIFIYLLELKKEQLIRYSKSKAT